MGSAAVNRRTLFKSLAGLAAGLVLGKRGPHLYSTNMEGTDVRDLGPAQNFQGFAQIVDPGFATTSTTSYTASGTTFTSYYVDPNTLRCDLYIPDLKGGQDV